MTDWTTSPACVVAGVQLPRPFQIRRLGHFGINVEDTEASLDFYAQWLGLSASDEIDFSQRLSPQQRKQVGPARGIFTRHGTDHHSFVLFPRRAMQLLNPHYANYPELTVNQITWQVSSLREVVDGHQWFSQQGLKILRAGRDLPGSNWHFYPPDPAGHINELYYGIEQIGWDGYSKSSALHKLKYLQPPELPQRSEFSEVNEALASQLRLNVGWRNRPEWAEIFDVGGVLLARPFKINKVGPVRLFVDDIESNLAFYRDKLGLSLTEEVVYQGHHCFFLRANSEHHALALYPKALRSTLGLSERSTLFSFGFQLGSYQQLREAHHFLKQGGLRFFQLPPELSPGIGHHLCVMDPDDNLIQLYWEMEQIGWDGKPRPSSLRRTFSPDPLTWPENLPAQTDSFMGEVLLGPLN